MKGMPDASIQKRTLDVSALTVNAHPFTRELRNLGATQEQLDALRFASFEGLHVGCWPIQYPAGFPPVGEELARQYLTLRWLEVDQLSLLEAREQARAYVEERERRYFEALGTPRERLAEPVSSGWRSRRISIRDAAMVAMRGGHEKGLTLEQWLEKDAGIASQRVRVVNQKHVAGYVVCVGDDDSQLDHAFAVEGLVGAGRGLNAKPPPETRARCVPRTFHAVRGRAATGAPVTAAAPFWTPALKTGRKGLSTNERADRGRKTDAPAAAITPHAGCRTPR